MLRHRSGEDREGGQIIVLFALVIVVVLGFAALVVDLGVLRNDRQTLANTVDAAALAGGTLMPVDGSVPGAYNKINSLVVATINANYPGLPSSAYTISYQCLIGADTSSSPPIPNVSTEVPRVCNPGPSHGWTGFTTLATKQAAFNGGAGKTRYSSCNPAAGDKCNAVRVLASVTTDYGFGRVVGVNSGSTGVVQAAACNGPCGEPPPPLNDVELIIDTSGSMQSNITNGHSRIYWAQLAAKQLVTDLNTNGGIGPTGNRVGITTFRGTTANSVAGAWTSTATQLATAIDALTASGNTPLKVGLQTGATDLGTHARNPVGGADTRVIILVSDGRPNPDLGPNGLPATVVNNNQRPTQANIASYLGSADITYSILIGDTSTSLPIGRVAPPNLDPNILDPGLMRLLATPDDLAANPPQRYYYNVVDASGLPDVFHQIAGQILGPQAHLIQLDPTPIVSGLGTSTGAAAGGYDITISGQYLTGASRVTFGGAPAASFTVNSDTKVTARVPAGTAGQTVDVIVSTAGGSSPTVTGDRFSYTP